MTVTRLYAVIPVHNGIEHTLPMIRSLLPLMPPQGRIVVVDDGSSDGTSAILEREHPEVVILQGDGNLWWSGAINMGAKHALDESADYVLLLNNDTVLHPQFLEELIAGAHEFPHSLVTSKILSEEQPQVIWSMGGRIDWLKGRVWMAGFGQPDDGSWNEPVEADWLPGMSVLVPADVFRQGIWVDEERFPQYSGDSDFSMRAKNAGFRLITYPKSRVYNKVNNSGLDTRLVKGLETMTVKKFLESLTSNKSSKKLKVNARWLMRHAPIWSWPMMTGRLYGYYLLKCLQLWFGLSKAKSTTGKACEDPIQRQAVRVPTEKEEQ
ncbi:hypothetical protein CEE37_02275 [candidate division LCP-89 bacterium B3_LCP]|uniref:Glycosyltransferase 2-like domain-containing protein n=1 Tax=candidate division LCP-89 bacterium B3_LCP TaxID=2012998 RepID=A0A532V5R0_UNCL8|nr:MAG: hypothetical protein CEE37_02275 [candidate division LCP-89 bacterium B3_LCP]